MDLVFLLKNAPNNKYNNTYHKLNNFYYKLLMIKMHLLKII